MAALSGKTNENAAAARIRTLAWNSNPFIVGEIAGSGHGPDVPVDVGGIKTAFEVKSPGAFETGQRCMRSLINGKIQLPQLEKNAAFNGLTGLLWEGRIPKFMTGDRSDPWIVKDPLSEARNFPDIYIPCTNPLAAANYYKNQGSDYIELVGIGLFHTGNDILGLGVPIFECPIEFRIRIKKHASAKDGKPAVLSVTWSMKVKKKPSSPFDLMVDAKLPPAITRLALPAE